MSLKDEVVLGEHAAQEPAVQEPPASGAAPGADAPQRRAPSLGRHRTFRRRRPVPRRLMALGLLPFLIGPLAAHFSSGSVERDLTHRVTSALVQDGLAGVEVDVDGRIVHLAVPSDVDAGRVHQVAEKVDGVAAIEMRGVL